MNPEQNQITHDSVWKILTIDNIASSNKIIELLSKNIFFQNRNLSTLKASSLQEGKNILMQHSDIAVILVDIMMEDKNSGLEFIKFVRNELKNREIRIILRTGYPNSLPEKQVIQNYEIDGYIPKEINSELQIEVTIITAIRNYNQITTTKKLLQSLSGSLSHELRSPLATIRGGVSALRMNLELAMGTFKMPGKSDVKKSSATSSKENVVMSLKDAKECLEYLELCDNVIDQGNMIIDLTLEKIHDKPLDKNRFIPTSILETVNQSVRQYTFNNQGEKEKIIVNIKKKDDFIYLGINDVMLFVLFNLIKNSLYYSAKKKELQITISTSKNNNWNYLHFKDNGPGIDPKRIPTIFNNFMTHDKIGGTGLGLPFCKRIMEDFGGTIECYSEVGKGTEFVMGFPGVK